MALNCLAFEKIAFLYFGDRLADRQTDRQANRWTGPLHEAALAVASGGLIMQYGYRWNIDNCIIAVENQALGY